MTDQHGDPRIVGTGFDIGAVDRSERKIGLRYFFRRPGSQPVDRGFIPPYGLKYPIARLENKS